MPSSVTTIELTRQIDASVAEMQTLVNGLTRTQIHWRPAPNAWSIVECLDHLNRTASIYLKSMRVAFERERHNSSLPPKAFRLGFIARQFVRVLEPPYHVRVKAPARVLPPSDLDFHEVEAEFCRLRLDLRGFLLEASRVDMGSIRFESPFGAILKLNLAEGCLVVMAHDRRHLWQAQNVRNHQKFPASNSGPATAALHEGRSGTG